MWIDAAVESALAGVQTNNHGLREDGSNRSPLRGCGVTRSAERFTLGPGLHSDPAILGTLSTHLPTVMDSIQALHLTWAAFLNCSVWITIAPRNGTGVTDENACSAWVKTGNC
jgi:hypothetical protein